jgi:hypothetical protein
MFDRIKNLKIVSKINKVSPKLKWLMYDGIKDYKINSNYLEMITGEKSSGCSHAKIEAMVRDMLTREFSDKIKDNKSFEMLVDATVHRIKVQQLEAMGDID